MSKRKRRQGMIREEKDRKPNPYWSQEDEDEHTPVEDDYGEDSDAESVSGRQRQKFEEEHLKNLHW